MYIYDNGCWLESSHCQHLLFLLENAVVYSEQCYFYLLFLCLSILCDSRGSFLCMMDCIS